MPLSGPRPEWLTFDCYGTLIQWDESLLRAVQTILAARSASVADPTTLIHTYDKHEHEFEQTLPHKPYRTVATESLRMAMDELELSYRPEDIEVLISVISRMPPFPEVVGALAALKDQGYRLCIISNTDDDIIAGNIAQLGGTVDRVVTAQQAEAYKPSRRIFDFAHRTLGVTKEQIVHICASPHLDLAAARDIGFRCVWVDRHASRSPLADYRPDATVSALDEVPELFKTSGW
jgi:2-haloacid dehalogenase